MKYGIENIARRRDVGKSKGGTGEFDGICKFTPEVFCPKNTNRGVIHDLCPRMHPEPSAHLLIQPGGILSGKYQQGGYS